MFTERVYNFSAGPSMWPEQVLKRAASELLNFGGSGMSVMEMSHRSKAYQEIFDETKALLKKVLSVPDTHEVLFMQGGATGQFAAVAMNLIGRTGKADYAVTGNFSKLAAKEAEKYGQVHLSCDTSATGHTTIPAQRELSLSTDASYFHYCANNTIYGTEWSYIPDTPCPLVADMSSNILSRPVDVSKYGLIYAGVQKNMAPAGMAAVIIDRSLAGQELPCTPTILNYKTTIDKDSMYNTPPTYNIYMLGLTLKWVEEMGGVSGMEELRELRAGMLYDFLDNSSLFRGRAEKSARSKMNVTFTTGDPDLDAKFIKEAAGEGLLCLAGHRIAGGMRASIYNAMPVEGVKKLTDLMGKFELANKI